MLCVLCLIVLWGFSLVTSYSGVIDYYKETLLLKNGVAAGKAKRTSRNVDEQQV